MFRDAFSPVERRLPGRLRRMQMTEYISPNDAAKLFGQHLRVQQFKADVAAAIHEGCCNIAERYGIPRDKLPRHLDGMIAMVGATSQRDVQDKADGYFARMALAEKPPQDEEAAIFSPRQLAERFGVPHERLRKRLDRWRKSNLDGWVEDTNRSGQSAQYLYRVNAVRHIIEEVKASNSRPAQKN